jgi:hypothetical protein
LVADEHAVDRVRVDLRAVAGVGVERLRLAAAWIEDRQTAAGGGGGHG